MAGAEPDRLRAHGEAFRRGHEGHLGRSSVVSWRRSRPAARRRSGAMSSSAATAAWFAAPTIVVATALPEVPGDGARGMARSAPGRIAAGAVFHVVFTLPTAAAEIAFQNKRVVYAILFQAAAGTWLWSTRPIPPAVRAYRRRNPATSAGSGRPATSSAPAFRAPACGRPDGAPAAVLPGTAVAASCGSSECPRAPAANRAVDSRTAAARRPALAIGHQPYHRRRADGGSGSSPGPSRSRSAPDARSPRDAHAGEQRPRAVRQASPFFAATSSAWRCPASRPPAASSAARSPPPASAADAPRTPRGRRTWPSTDRMSPGDAVLTAHIRRLGAGFLLAQNADDLLIGEPRSSHPSASCSGGLHFSPEEIQGRRSLPKQDPRAPAPAFPILASRPDSACCTPH